MYAEENENPLDGHSSEILHRPFSNRLSFCTFLGAFSLIGRLEAFIYLPERNVPHFEKQFEPFLKTSEKLFSPHLGQ
jgi:hypothetical protein